MVLDRARRHLQHTTRTAPPGWTPQWMVASVIDDHPGFPADHVPFLSPDEWHRRTAAHVRARIAGMLEAQGCAGTTIWVGSGPERETLIDFALGWRADIVVIGSHARFGLPDAANPPTALPFDLDIVDTRRSLADVALGYIAPFLPAPRAGYCVDF